MGFFGSSKKIEETNGAESAVTEKAAPPPPAPAANPPGASRPPAATVGIDYAVQLMRSLPTNNIELVVQVVRRTLESLNIHVTDIVRDAAKRQKDIQTRVGQLNNEIMALQAEVERRQLEIKSLEAAHGEVTLVKERLEAEEIT